MQKNGLAVRVGAVLVTYHPEDEVMENISRLAAQADELVVVDNGSSETFWIRLREQFPDLQFRLISNPKNLGIATAFNLGARALLESGCDFVMTFDQDSVLPPGYVAALLEGFYAAKAIFGQVGVFASYYRDENSGLLFPNHFQATSDYVIADSTISSGNLIPAETFLKIGFFRDDFFIDAVDTEYHLRASDAGLPLILTPNVVLPHRIGNQRLTRLLWLEIPLTSHNYIRRYYMARNRVHTYKLFAARHPSWFRLELRMFLGDFLTMIFFEQDRLRKLKFTLKGISDGIKGRFGALES